MAVRAAGAQLIAERRFRDHNVHKDREQNRNDNAAVHLRAGEELVEPELGGGDIVVGRFVDVAGLGVLHHVLEIADIKKPRDNVRRDPVGHNAGDDLVDVQQRLEHAGDRAPERARRHAAEERQQPDDHGGNLLGRNAQRDEKRGARSGEILSRSADVEKAGLERRRHRETREDQRRGAEEHIADARGVEAERQRAGGVAPGAEKSEQHEPDALPCALESERLVGDADDENEHRADQKADENGEQRSDDRTRAVLMPEGGLLFFHFFSSPFCRFAPAM